MEEFEALLKRHLLRGILEAAWIHPATGMMPDDSQFFSAFQELMAYAFDEHARLQKENSKQTRRRAGSDRDGLLAEMRALLEHYRADLLAQSGRLLQEGAT